MVQKYQNEIAPIFYYDISAKTIETDLKIPILQPPDWKSPYWMSLYVLTIVLSFMYLKKYFFQIFDFDLEIEVLKHYFQC